MHRYQLMAYDQPYGPVSDNGSWQVGNWGDTMMLTNVAMPSFALCLSMLSFTLCLSV